MFGLLANIPARVSLSLRCGHAAELEPSLFFFGMTKVRLS